MNTQTVADTRQTTVALVGNPNSGKTTLFNLLTGSHQKVGNWSGVTVERRDGWMRRNGRMWRITDLPGMYSLSAESPDEAIACDFIVRGVQADARPDLVIQVIDGGSLERSLLLTFQLLEQEMPLIIVINMWDEVQRRGLLLDPQKLRDLLGVSLVTTVGSRGVGLEELVAAMEHVASQPAFRPPRPVIFDPSTEQVLVAVQELCADWGMPATRGFALGLMMEDASAYEVLPDEMRGDLSRILTATPVKVGASWSDSVTHARYTAISRLVAQVSGPTGAVQRDRLTERIDSVLIHRVWGLPLFLLIMALLFELTFVIGAYPMDWIDQGVSAFGDWMRILLPAGFIQGLLVDGVVSGAGMVLVFLPNIVILLIGIHLLEDSGYMARAAFLMDRIMRIMGLHGRSFIPLLMGFGCNVPALMASRTLESRRDRLLTMLLTPLMSCSARLPVYVMVSAAFFPRTGGLVIFCLYTVGTLIAIGLGRLFSRTLLKGQTAPFIMELPPYRWPTSKTTFTILRFTTAMYLRRIGRIVLIFAVAIWFLSNFPRPPESSSGETDPQQSALGETTYIYQIGRVIEPVMEPLGFTLPLNIALVSGFVAKEVVVATMGVLMGGGQDMEAETLVSRLREHIPSPAVALAFLVFVLLYTPCLTTVVTLQRESRHWAWTAFSILYQTAAAWGAAFLTLLTARLFGFG